MRRDLFPWLDEIEFAAKDAAQIEADVLARFEEAAGRTLAKGDPVRLLLETVAFALVHQRWLIDFTGKQNLLAYAEGQYLDHLGEFWGVHRMAAKGALTTLRFDLSAPSSGSRVLSAGTRAAPRGSQVQFATVEDVEIPSGATHVDALAECSTQGTAGNGYAPGEVCMIVDPFPWEMSVRNITETSGGADVEDDDNLRARIQLAPESLSVAGSRGSYAYWARTAHQDIIDVAVVGPPRLPPGYVELYPLMRGGVLPSPEVLRLVAATCNADDVRPLTDALSVKVPGEVGYRLEVTWWLDREAQHGAASIERAVDAAVADWIQWQRSRLGRDVNPSELTKRMVAAGAKRVEIVSPAFRMLLEDELAVCERKVVTFGGIEDG